MGISPDDWERVKTLLEEALQLESRDVPAFLDRTAPDDNVRHELERLLRYRSQIAGFPSATAEQQTADIGVPHRLNSGTVLCKRFQVVRFIAAGGMGEIYEARDQELQETVAIKTIRHDLANQPAFLHRFRREVRLARQVTHPNVCRIYDLFQDSDTDGGCHFVSMEFLNGETLAERLRRSGRMKIAEALPVISEMAGALSAAHAAGILHRDFKTGNVMLVSPSHEERVRTVVTDFGLAFRFTGGSTTRDAPTQFVGTPAYMSPEQIEGRELTQASDIYALGLVMYEVVTGKTPFDATPTGLGAMRRLYEDPVPPRSYCPDLDGTLEKIILQCLERDPSNRPQNAQDVIQAVSSIGLNAKSRRTHAHDSREWAILMRQSKAKLAIVLVSLIVLATLGTFAYLHLRATPPQEVTTMPVVRRRTVAVLNLKNSASRPEATWLATALPEMLTTELAAGERLRTIPRGEVVEHMKTNPSLGDADIPSAAILSQVGKNLGADLMVLGSYVDLSGGKLRIDLHLQDSASGEILMSVKETGDEDHLFDLVNRAGAQLREKCNAGPLNTQDQTAVRAAFPSTQEAARLYAEGIAKLRVNEATAARDFLQKAVAADPNHALAHSALGAAWSLLGYDEKARLSAKSAYDLSDKLSREDRLLTEARYREASKEWDNAAANYRTLFGYFPDNLEYGLLLARSQARGGKGKEALSTVEALRRLPPPDRDDPRIDLSASEASKYLGDFKQTESFAAQAVQKARTRGAKLLLARALYQQGAAFESLSDPKSAITTVEEAARIYHAVGDRNGVASTLEVTAQALAARGDYPGALAKYNNQLTIAREIGNRRAESSALNNMALILDSQGNAEEARGMWEKAVPVFREISDKNNQATTLLNIAGIMKDEGDLRAAKKTYSEALSIFREVNNQDGIAISLTAVGTVLDGQGDSTGAKRLFEQSIALEVGARQANPSADKLIALGDALQHLGDLPNARKNYEKAVALARDGSDKDVAAFALMGLGSLELTAANFVQARKDYEEALAFRNELGEKDNAAATRVAIAELAIEEGHPEAAEGPAREAREDLHRGRKSDDQIAATIVLVNALLAEGKTDEALKELGKAAPTAARSQTLSVQLAFSLVSARAKGVSKQLPAAKNLVTNAQVKATKSGYIGYQLESLLALEEIELKSGKSGASRTRLGQLEKKAKEKGFELIAHKVAAL
jgi:serine/threonine protein kinase/tetratricopeptide (TPR) repeat protein